MSQQLVQDQGEATLCEALDRVLNRGAVVSGDVVISVADVDLLYLNLKLFLSSVDKAMEAGAFVTADQENRR